MINGIFFVFRKIICDKIRESLAVMMFFDRVPFCAVLQEQLAAVKVLRVISVHDVVSDHRIDGAAAFRVIASD